MTRGRVSLIAAGAVTLVMLAGCNTTEAGTPSPGGGGTSADSTPKPGTSTPSSPKTTSSGSNVDACSLFPDADAAGMGLPTPGKAKRIAGIPGCSWAAPGQFGVNIAIDNKGLKGAVGDTVSLPKHKAIKMIDAGGFSGCSIVLEISDAASAIVAVSLSGGKPGAEACPRTNEVAKIVDSKLP